MTPTQSLTSPRETGKDFHNGGNYLGVVGVVLLSTLGALGLERIDSALSMPVHSANLVMPYLLGVVFSAVQFKRWPAILVVVLNLVSFTILFVGPIYQKRPQDLDYILVFIVFLVVAILVNELSFKARKQADLLARNNTQIERERMKNTLLRSVSHDLRSPLATIMGAASSLVDAMESGMSSADCKELAQSICKESKRLDRHVANLLEMTTLESTGLLIRKEWYSIDEILGDALTQLEGVLGTKEIDLEIQQNLPLVFVDGLLIEKVLVNLIENCLKYAPEETYRVAIRQVENNIEVEVFNSGKPLKKGEEEKIFEKFYRGTGETDGAGLGLAICRSSMQLHNGKIWAEKDLTNGVSIKFVIPVPTEAPKIESEIEE